MVFEIITTLMFSFSSILTKSLGMIFDFLVYVVTLGKYRFRSRTNKISIENGDTENVFNEALPDLFKENERKHIFKFGDKTRLVLPTLRVFSIETKDTIGKKLFGEYMDRISMQIIRGGRKIKRLGGMSILSLVGCLGLGMSWAAALELVPYPCIALGVLSIPNCIVYYVVLNRVLVLKLLKNFTFWYLLFNILGVFISLGRLFWDFRIVTLLFAFPNLTLAIFLDALPYAYRYRTWVSFWSLNLITLCLTQYIIFTHSMDIEYSIRIDDDIQIAVPVTHVASSCNINLLILSAQFMFTLMTSPNSLVILHSPLESAKVDSDIAKVGLMVMSSLGKPVDGLKSTSSENHHSSSNELGNHHQGIELNRNETKVSSNYVKNEMEKNVAGGKASRQPREI